MAFPTSKFLIVTAALLVVGSGAVAENYDELSRSDSISVNAGDANAANMAIQAEDMWPSYLNQTHIHTDGTQMELVIKKFHKRHSADQAAPSTVINIGTPAAP
jgi:peptide deformylase